MTNLIVVRIVEDSDIGTFVQKLAAKLRLGRLPGTLRTQVESEGRILYLAEGILETAIFRHYKTPNACSSHRRIAFIGYFALSERRIVAKAKCYHEIDVNVAYDDALFKSMTFAVRPKYLSLAIDASAQSAQASGQMELRLHLPYPAAAAKILEQAGTQMLSK